MGLLGERYRLIEPLGTGGMSVVWRAYDEVLGRPVAVKVLAPRFADDAQFRDRIRAEARAVARLVHPHITAVYDYGESTTDGALVPFVVMELVDGRSLASGLADGPLPWRTAVEACAQVAAALSAAHARGLVHRDITPANVMLTQAGAKVIDFGVSAVVGDGDGPVIGTPPFMAPERLAGESAGPPVDVYGLGVLLHVALTGSLPTASEPSPPQVLELPDDVAVLCVQCRAADPAARPSSAEVAHRLAAAVGARLPIVDAGAGSGGTGDAAGHDAGSASSDFHAPTGTRVLPEREQLTVVRPVQGWTGARVAVAAAIVVVAVVAALVGASALRTGGVAPGGGNVAAAPPASSPPAAIDGRCSVAVSIKAWDGGATLGVTVTNHGDDLAGWTLTFTLAGNQRVVQNWNGNWDQSGDRVTVHDVEWNAPVATGASFTVGANLERRGKKSTDAPQRFALNGRPCTVTRNANNDRDNSGSGNSGSGNSGSGDSGSGNSGSGNSGSGDGGSGNGGSGNGGSGDGGSGNRGED